MKTQKIAISLPGDVLARAERMARRLKRSRSQVISDAINFYVARHEPDAVTAAINLACDQEDDPRIYRFGAAAAAVVLEGVEW